MAAWSASRPLSDKQELSPGSNLVHTELPSATCWTDLASARVPAKLPSASCRADPVSARGFNKGWRRIKPTTCTTSYLAHEALFTWRCTLNSLRLHCSDKLSPGSDKFRSERNSRYLHYEPDRQPTGVQRALAHFWGKTRCPKEAVGDDDPNLNPGPKQDQPDRQPTGAVCDADPNENPRPKLNKPDRKLTGVQRALGATGG
ncbi:hypothetical protein DPMN_076946 [Dreissena polymorpha]|uniref:Uncharacterized protein n=1 Tax=Dreissena polymorpha TaxID=45954 RepID=A0A9D3YN09_DREPO|nr:hypothetical protein DPMN_076946 [Dreissena polymorpha]